jgi:hypothetical protein
VPPSEKDHIIPVFSEVDSITWPHVDSQFMNAMPDWLTIAEVALHDSIQPGSNGAPKLSIPQSSQPSAEEIDFLLRDVVFEGSGAWFHDLPPRQLGASKIVARLLGGVLINTPNAGTT